MSEVFHQPSNLWFRIVLGIGSSLLQDKEPKEAKWQTSLFVRREVLEALNPNIILGHCDGVR